MARHSCLRGKDRLAAIVAAMAIEFGFQPPPVPAIAEDFPLGNEPYRVGLRGYHDGTPENALNRLLTSIPGG
jgi:hypothetical protein